MLVIKITGEENVVCDCRGDTVGKYVDRLTVAIIKTTDVIMFCVSCPECDSDMGYEVTSKLILESHPDF